ncbi:GNAT family N-acetyltransferase [Vibrio sonorensis]|uniref:GNAT family N-acetyltransferase n=1 Tax=Vibrio sonorensis TaxID=1004316 RepID=UPI0008D96DC6|nr:GNAT family N-acetyltransferase [Vibrio sonorensis]
MTCYLSYIKQELENAAILNIRSAIRLVGTSSWQESLLRAVCNLPLVQRAVQLGGQPLDHSVQHYAFNKGQQLLGQEVELLILDVSENYDSNSFSSALGALKGGGLLIVVGKINPLSFADKWMERALNELTVLSETESLPVVLPTEQKPIENSFSQQFEAIAKIEKVLIGHRKRPLVLTANRGRGKTSALGFAAANIMAKRSVRILVTAPAMASVEPLFKHALERLPEHAQYTKGKLTFEDASVQFVAPDELVSKRPECDLLFVDEAAAIPLPLLIQMVSHYHRAVFSTTVHGYEGCGRGFTLKFQSWLDSHRPGWKSCHLTQPIRWSECDPLEKWHYKTYLLDSELAAVGKDEVASNALVELDAESLFNCPIKLASCFALLVNAHYQTSPNDLMMILGDEKLSLFASFNGDVCIQCVLVVKEGEIPHSLITEIESGKRRPKGQLVASTMITQLALPQMAAETSYRIMRIAVHPDLQQQGFGSNAIRQIRLHYGNETLTTSFGATSELLAFWQKNGFRCVRIGTSRDHTSGCHSVIMINSVASWLSQATSMCADSLSYLYSTSLRTLPVEMVKQLPLPKSITPTPFRSRKLLDNYLLGSANYESIAPFLLSILLAEKVESEALPDCIIRKVFQQWSWQECANEFGVAGRKQMEVRFKQSLGKLLL